tara:strand:+ start:84 stop:353 length:270 start_codon:yes stop_codon:yes gene_type:complete
MCRNDPGPQNDPAPTPIQPRQPDLLRASRLPDKKELLDPEDIAQVEYGQGTGTEKKDPRMGAKRTGTDALKINVNTGAGEAGSGGVMNV